MDKIKRPGRVLSLRKSLVLYVTVFALLALMLSILTGAVCGHIADTIKAPYPLTSEKYYLTNEQGERLGNGSYIGSMSVPLSAKDEHIVDFLDMFPVIAVPVYSAVCIITAALLFYKNKLRKPLAQLQAASEKISDNNLDFSIEYDCKDELGQLCDSFETMRATLADNFSEMWRQVEERKQLNAAFAHDLRTPLTVLKGYQEMLQASEDTQTKETAVIMGKHISRMEAYVSSMSRLRRLEDTQPEYKETLMQPLIVSLKESAQIICTQNGKNLQLQIEDSQESLFLSDKTEGQQLSVDPEFISQVCSNLIANAVRYARTSVTLSFALENNGLMMSVSDDGKGFDKISLHKAANPYFTEESNRFEHFGLGLYICKLLCEHHGGSLKIDNSSNGAKVTAFFKTPVRGVSADSGRSFL